MNKQDDKIPYVVMDPAVLFAVVLKQQNIYIFIYYCFFSPSVYLFSQLQCN